MPSPPSLSDLVRAEREAFIAMLGSLAPEQWHERSLCTDWRIIDVAAHLAWAPVLGPVAGAMGMLRSRLSVNRMIASSAVGWSSRGTDAILDQLGRNLESDARPIGMPVVAALADAVVHGLDVRRPLGLTRPISAEVLDPIARFVLHTPWPLNSVVGGNAAQRVTGVRLVADDADWSHGEGPEVHASAETIALLLYGRPVGDGELTGKGADTVRVRL